MSAADDDLGESWADDSELSDAEEADALTADIASIMAGRTVVPAAILWWRTRRERQAAKEASASGTTGRTRRPRWFEL